MTRRTYLEGSDVMKAEVFGTIETHWATIRPKVEVWIKAGWWAWEREKPEWFTDEWKLSVPEDLIPEKKKEVGRAKSSVEEETRVVAVRQPVRQPERRNSAILQLAAGGVVHAVRRKSVATKVAPAGMNDGGVVDAEEFVKEMERRGSLKL
ncbi:hypothetical protein TrLO_g12896 [Triparma laevis f. longispina]|nr:hypothetical protein TrLO_g12896 [Triparma laevis f. longispina]